MKLLTFFLAFGGLFLASCDFDQLTGGGGGGGTVQVTYEVTGPASADITYQNKNQDTSQETGAALPWTYSFTAEELDFLYVSAQNNGGGTIICTLKIDGNVAESNSSKGEFAICTASGNV